jgi:hypothetical protein
VHRTGYLSLLLLAAACSSDADGGSSTNARGNDGTEPPPDTTGEATGPGGASGATGASSKPGIDHLLVTGQSNSVGFAAAPALTTTQPATSLMFDTGVITARRCDDDGCSEYAKPGKLVPLVEGDTYFDYPVETVASGFANGAQKLVGPPRQLLVSIHGRSGNSYACLRKGGCDFYGGRGYVGAFDEALSQVADAKALAASQGVDYAVRAVAVIHGESDHYAPPFPLDGTDGAPQAIKTYADALVEWQRDYDAAIRAATGQSSPVVMLVSQMSNWNDRSESEIPGRQLEAHVRASRKVVLIGPTYMLPFAGDCIHFTNHGERQLGEYFAKAYAKTLAGGFEPVRPLGATIADDTITIKFAVPSPPLVLDTAAVTDPGDFGFEFADDSGAAPKIAEVAVAGPDAVTIRLERAPTAGGKRVRYAMRATPNTCPGPETGPRGNLRDSDATSSLYGYDLHNWAVHFDVAVP